jgi:hypothetical protein
MSNEIKSRAAVLSPRSKTAKEKVAELAVMTEDDTRKKRCFTGHRSQKLTKPIDDIKAGNP